LAIVQVNSFSLSLCLSSYTFAFGFEFVAKVEICITSLGCSDNKTSKKKVAVSLLLSTLQF